MITIKAKGDWKKTNTFLERLRDFNHTSILDKYGAMGVEALRANTPIESGATASSWRYEVTRGHDHASIEFHNDNINEGVNIALILQLGHGTGTGGWVEGRDYINPVIQPLFDKMAEDLWKEVTAR